jgi:hypothetical protein
MSDDTLHILRGQQAADTLRDTREQLKAYKTAQRENGEIGKVPDDDMPQIVSAPDPRVATLPPEEILAQILAAVNEKKLQIRSMRINSSVVNEAKIIVEINLARDTKPPVAWGVGQGTELQQRAPTNPLSSYNPYKPGPVKPWPPVPKPWPPVIGTTPKPTPKPPEPPKRKPPPGTRDLDLD